jgi:hypothetical protein
VALKNYVVLFSGASRESNWRATRVIVHVHGFGNVYLLKVGNRWLPPIESYPTSVLEEALLTVDREAYKEDEFC